MKKLNKNQAYAYGVKDRDGKVILSLTRTTKEAAKEEIIKNSGESVVKLLIEVLK